MGKSKPFQRLRAIEPLQRTDTDPRLTFRLPAPLSSPPGSVSVFGLAPPPPPRPCELVCCALPPLGEPTLGRGLANPIVDLRTDSSHYSAAGENVTPPRVSSVKVLLFSRVGQTYQNSRKSYLPAALWAPSSTAGVRDVLATLLMGRAAGCCMVFM